METYFYQDREYLASDPTVVGMTDDVREYLNRTGPLKLFSRNAICDRCGERLEDRVALAWTADNKLITNIHQKCL